MGRVERNEIGLLGKSGVTWRNKCFSLLELPAERVNLILATPIKRFADQLSPPNPSTPDLLLSNRLLEHVFYIFELAKSAHWWSKLALLASTWCVELT